ncbi:DUF418 domain-containing protein [Algoriphagus aquimarinus]|uniref:DUF418 domain-containing protein n=1 Tax=Algoriphagus aquimarinus TaxID=237018 RepID=A0A1I0WGU7_9BACT|nr:DUF418 domain-containing protein [Algoriphagus aquimarinus]SFA87794.1 uncharacterized protein SAMN04489723_102130 [Algoriphagus aquimarinus]
MTESAFQEFKPLKQSDRILSLDVMRGIVLCGILLMNINGYGLYESYSDPTVTGGSTGLNLYTWMTTNMLFEGTMRALFSLLFGVGMFMFLDRLLKKGAGIKAADIYFRRITWLLVFGLIHGYLLLWTGEILYQYALMGFLVYSFRSMAPKFLIATAIVLFSIGTFWLYVNYTDTKKWIAELEEVQVVESKGEELTKELKSAKTRWEKYEEKRSPEAIQEYNDEMHKGYFKVVAHLAPENFDSDTLWPYKYDVWDVLSMMLIGMALFKLGVLTGEKANSFYLAMAGIGYTIGLLINYYELNLISEDNFSLLSKSKSMITYYWGRLFVAMGHVGLIMLFCKAPILGWLKSSIAAVGKMALTNYLMHSVICMIIFTGVGFGMFGKLQRYELLYVVFGIWIFQLILSPIWLRYFHYGPAEWLWRNLSYGKVHGFRKLPVQTL